MWHKSPSTAATDYVKDSVEDLAQGVHSRASGSSGDRQMRLYVCSHSASERSVWYALLISCPASYRASASGPLFRQFQETVRKVWTETQPLPNKAQKTARQRSISAFRASEETPSKFSNYFSDGFLPCILFSVVKTAADAGATDRSSTSLGE
jgi:hypothetical protein